MADLDRLIHRLYRVVALEPHWEEARLKALEVLAQWSDATSAVWLTGAGNAAGPVRTSTLSVSPVQLDELRHLPQSPSQRTTWLSPLPATLAVPGCPSTVGCVIDYQHRDTHLSSRVLLTFATKPDVGDDTLSHAIGHLVEAGTLAFDLLLARDSWLGAMGRPTRGAGALIDPKGAYYAVSPAFSTVMNHSFGSGISTGQLPVPLSADALDPHKTFTLGRLQARVSPQGPLWLIHVRTALPIDKLSPREQEVARHLSEGKTFKRIAQQLGLSPSTVANHSASIYRKLGVYRREDLISQVRTDVKRKSA